MSAAAMLGNQGIPSDHPLGKSFTKRSSSNASLDDAASCLWENEPMSAAASLITVLRSSLPAVPESEQTPDEPPSSKRKGVPRLAVNTGARHSHHGTAWRPRRPAPSPPQRANSFPLPQQNEDFLEYDIVNNGLTLQETPRSSRSSVKDFPAAAPLPAPAMRNEPAEPIAFGPANSVSELAHHHNAHDSAMHAHVTSVPEAVSETVPAQLVGEAAVPTIAHMQVHDASIAASAVTAPQAHSAETGASAPAYIASDDSIINRFIEDALQLSRKGSVATLYESAHSGSVGLPDDVPTI